MYIYTYIYVYIYSIYTVYIYSIYKQYVNIDSNLIQTPPLRWLEFCDYLILKTIKHVSLFGQIVQWLERVHGKHKLN